MLFSIMKKGSLSATSLPTLVIFFLIIAILSGVRYMIAYKGFCLSLMISDVEHLPTYLMSVCMSPLQKFLFNYLPTFCY